MNKSSNNIDSELESFLLQCLQQGSDYRYRQLLIVSGPQPWCMQTTNHISGIYESSKKIVVSDENFTSTSNIELIYNHNVNSLLGQEFELVVFDTNAGFNPDALAAISGTVTGGGLLVLLTPELDNWTQYNDPDNKKLHYWPHDQEDVGDLFISRFTSLLKDHGNISFYDHSSGLTKGSLTPPPPTPGQAVLPYGCLTQDQATAVDAILHTARGHRRRPLVITANRGRGKSAALGIAAAQLINEKSHIIVTAPSFATTQVSIQIAEKLLPDFTRQDNSLYLDDQRIQYYAPDALLNSDLSCDILLVDEAAAIPTPLLTQLLIKYPRIIFSSTIHGYEGTGRGFALRFYNELDICTPGWKLIELQQPIRWAQDDPVENFIFNAFLLNANLPDYDNVKNCNGSNIHIQKLAQQELANNPQDLSELFALLVYAHYQTHPRDLRFLLDSMDLDIYVARYNGHIVATALVQKEGGFTEELSNKTYNNERRLIGHILPQTLESQLGLIGASRLTFRRVVRIAVHPQLQRQQIGSKLLNKIIDLSKSENIDIIGSSFGLTADLLPFWQKTSFKPVHVGLKRNASSGTHSVCMLQAISQHGQNIVNDAIEKYNSEFSMKLTTVYKHLPVALIADLLFNPLQKTHVLFTQHEYQELQSFANSQRELENCLLILQKFYTALIQRKLHSVFTDRETQLIVAKILQFHTWENICKTSGITGKKQGIQKLKSLTKLALIDDQVSKLIKIS